MRLLYLYNYALMYWLNHDLPLQNLFQTGNVIQLISRSNGGCLEIVQGPNGLAVDGKGPEGAQHGMNSVLDALKTIGAIFSLCQGELSIVRACVCVNFLLQTTSPP